MYVIKFDISGYSLLVVLSSFYILLSILTLFLQKARYFKTTPINLFLFAFYTVAVTIVSGGNLIAVLGFVLNYSVLFCAILTLDDKAYFRRYTYIYASGLLVASIVRLISYSVPEIDHFIESMTIVNTVKTMNSISTRFTGLDLDPNYFSLQVLIAMACLLVLFNLDGKKEKSQLYYS